MHAPHHGTESFGSFGPYGNFGAGDGADESFAGSHRSNTATEAMDSNGAGHGEDYGYQK